jgi:HlyD family secretion protein
VRTFQQKVFQNKKWLGGAIILAIAATAGIGYYYGKASKPTVAGQIVAVQRGDVLAAVSATGTITAVNSVDVSARITGLITEVKVNENDIVKAGQVLILLDDTSLKSQVSQAQAQLASATANYQRSKRLVAAGNVSIQQEDADRTNYGVALAAYENAVSQLNYTVITAPMDGVVVGKPIPAGQTVAPGISSPMVLLTVVDMSMMQIKVQVDESDIGKVQLGQKVNFMVDSYPRTTFAGVVSLISQKAAIQQNVVYYTVYVDIDASQGLLFPGMTARVTIKIGESRNTLTVPLAAVREHKGKKYLQVMVGDKLKYVSVQLGLSDNDKTEIISGVNEGTQIVIPAPNKPQATPNQSAGHGSSSSLRMTPGH